jgi:hypothetical protein
MGPAGAMVFGFATSMISTPPMPTRFIASKSAVMPSLEIFPLIQNQYAHGLAASGGYRKSSFSPAEMWEQQTARMRAVKLVASILDVERVMIGCSMRC